MTSAERSTIGSVLAAGLLAAACTVSPPHGSAARPPATILHGDTRATQFGATGASVLTGAPLEPAVRALFGADWGAGTASGFSAGAREFFEQAEPPRVVRVGSADYVAVPGCRSAACTRDEALLLVRPDGGELLARVDQGGFSRYYAYGPNAAITPESRATIDAAWLAFRPLGAAPY